MSSVARHDTFTEAKLGFAGMQNDCESFSEELTRVAIAGPPRLGSVKQSLAFAPRRRGSRSVPRYFWMKSKKTLTLGVKRELSEYRAQGTTGFGCHPGKMGTSRLAMAGSRAIYKGKIAIPASSSTSCRCTRGSSVTTRGAISGVTVFLPWRASIYRNQCNDAKIRSAGSAGIPAFCTYLRLANRPRAIPG